VLAHIGGEDPTAGVAPVEAFAATGPPTSGSGSVASISGSAER
jgi:hypothetical protein